MVSGSQLLSQHLSLGPEIRSLTLHPEKAMDRCSIYIERKRKVVLQPHKLTKQSKQPNVHVMPSQTEKVLTRVAEARRQKKYLALSVTACLFVCLNIIWQQVTRMQKSDNIFVYEFYNS